MKRSWGQQELCMVGFYGKQIIPAKLRKCSCNNTRRSMQLGGQAAPMATPSKSTTSGSCFHGPR